MTVFTFDSNSRDHISSVFRYIIVGTPFTTRIDCIRTHRLLNITVARTALSVFPPGPNTHLIVTWRCLASEDERDTGEALKSERRE